jgi:hypothetical protein
MARAGRWMRTLLAYGMPAYLVVLLTITAQGAAAPWPPARDVLARHADQWPLMVGVSTQAVRSPERGLQTAKSRYYVLLPGVLREPRLLRITQVDGGPVRESSSRAGFWGLLAAVIACMAGTWWFWLRPQHGAAGEREG